MHFFSIKIFRIEKDLSKCIILEGLQFIQKSFVAAIVEHIPRSK